MKYTKIVVLPIIITAKNMMIGKTTFLFHF